MRCGSCWPPFATVDAQRRRQVCCSPATAAGTRLFPEPHHDAGLVHEYLGEIPLAGFFAAGELGPIGGKNFMHGFTASLALFGYAINASITLPWTSVKRKSRPA